MNTKSALIIFAREPKDGKVKTRLARDLPVRAVTRLYKAFIRDVIKIALKVPCTERFLFYDAGTGSSIPFLRKAASGFRLKKQAGKDLGERMHKAFEHCHKNGFRRVAIIGSDCVTVNARDIETAFHKLSTHDCVLGPAKDGGYYLIAMSRPCGGIFRGVAWGTSAVLEQTLGNVRALGKTVFLLRQHDDFDEMDDLRAFSRAAKGVPVAMYTQKVLEKLAVPTQSS